MALGSIILGIVGIIFTVLFVFTQSFDFLGVLISAVGIYLALRTLQKHVMDRTEKEERQAKIGLTVSIIGALGGIIVWIVYWLTVVQMH